MPSIWDFPGRSVVKTLNFHCRGHRFNSWSGKQDPTCCTASHTPPTPKQTREKVRDVEDKTKNAICGSCLNPDLNKPTTKGILDTTKKNLLLICNYLLKFLNYDLGLVVIYKKT